MNLDLKTNQIMKIKELLRNVAKLVESREIINHGSIRCLHSEYAVTQIESAEECDEVETGTVGDDDLSSELIDLAYDGDRLADLDVDDLADLMDKYLGEDIADYVNEDKEDELMKLDSLIDAARELV